MHYFCRKGLGMRNRNVLKRIEIVQNIVKENYEPGNQARSQVQVLRNVLIDIYPMSERTFRRYMKINIKEEKIKIERGQLFIDF